MHGYTLLRPLLVGLILAVSLACTARAQPGFSAAMPSFDCARASTASEVAICRDPVLARADAAVAAAFSRAAAAVQGADAAALTSGQRAWLRQRNACQADPGCLQRAMAQRVAELLAAPGQAGAARAAELPARNGTVALTGAGPLDCSRPLPGALRLVCTQPRLAELDRRMAATYAAAAAAPNAPPQLAPEQTQWLAARDACPTENCLISTYEYRLTQLELVAPAPAIGLLDEIDSRSAAAARAWGLPTLLGLPYLPRVDQAGFGSSTGGDSPDRPIGLAVLGLLHRSDSGPQIDSAPPSVRAWTRLVNAIGIATSAEIVAKLDDAATVSLACLYLPATGPNPAGGRSCHDLTFATSGAGRDLFALRDLATSARSTVFPAQTAAAPALPFRLMITIPVLLRYNIKAGQFTLGAPERVTIFGSTTDTIVQGLTWAPPEAQARAMVEGQQSGQSLVAYLGLRLTLTGSMSRETTTTADWSVSTGLPTGRFWRIEGDRLALYADSALTRKLKEFDQPRRLTLPAMGSARETAPRPFGPVPLNADAAFLFMLQSGQLDPATQRWGDLAQVRYSAERTWETSARWRDFDAWGLFFSRPPSDNASTAAFREWTLHRAAALPPQLEYRQAALTDGTSTRVVAFPPTVGLSLDTATRDALKALGLTQANVLSIRLSQPGQRAAEIIAVLPAPVDTYDMPLPQEGRGIYSLRGGEDQATIRTLLHPVDARPLLPGLTLLRLEPQSEALYAGDRQVATRVLQSVPWPAPPQAPPPMPTPPSAAARFAAGAFGPDIVGLRLGIPADEAEAAIRSHMQVGQEFVTQDPRPGQAQPPAWLRGHLFETADGSEKIAVFRNTVGGPARVVGLWRQFVVPTTPFVVDQAKEALKAKYGAPSLDRGAQIAWNANPAVSACQSGLLTTWEWHRTDPSEGGNPADKPSVFIAYPPQGTPIDYNRCGPLLSVSFGNVPTTTNGTPRTSLIATLSDLGIMQWLAAQPVAAPAAPPPPPMKF